LKQSAGVGQRWRWAPGLFALVLVLGLAQSGVLQPLERLIYNQTLGHFAPDGRSGKVVVFELPQDEEQWSQAQLAELMKRTWRARAVGMLPSLTRKENHLAEAIVAGRLEAIPEGAKRSQEPWPTLAALQQELDVESRLAEGIRNSANVILAASWRPRSAGAAAMRGGPFGVVAPATLPLADLLPSVIAPTLLHADALHLPRDPLREAAAGVGLLNDGAEGCYPALIAHRGEGYPGMLLQLLRLNARAMGEGQTAFLAKGGVQLGPLRFPTDRAYRFYPYVPLRGAALSGIEVYPLAELLEGSYTSKHFEDKTILIGHTGEGSPLVPLALSLDALLQQRAVAIPAWAVWGQYGALAAVTLLLMFLLPRLRLSTSSVTVLLVLLLLANGEFLLLLLGKQWLPLTLPLLTLLLGYPLVSLHGAVGRHAQGLQRQLCETNRQLGRMLQNQGELEQALEKYRRCRVDEELLAQLYHLGLDFERKRQFSKAVSVFRHIEEHSAGFRDVAERIERNQAVEQRIVLAKGGPATQTGTVIMTSEGLQKPTLGHYQIEREIGRGAMGMVYLGKDPRIGREVAIKTMSFSSEFEGAQLKEVKARFYREAETAGRLNHPNIVHIYDIGEEHELAYIAMDYLRGENLARFTAADALLPINEVLAIAEQVAEALDYAHRKNVVHRDIKPANIIYDRGEAAVKVTDFGVACLTDSSKTKTGTVLGSPSYMSPEQVAGRKVDGRSDIFSLGVTIYQMVTGHLPFEADTLGSLMYKITNEEHPKPGKFRKGIPACVSRIINRCMQKDPQKRYLNGGELAAALRRCRK
jgi:serine/threonine-protein kinase